MGLEEDLEWKNLIQSYLYNSNPPNDYENDKPLKERKGKIWGLANQLVADGWVVDTIGYSTCFRVNYNAQDGTVKSFEEFEKLSSIVDDDEYITSSVNLGCIRTPTPTPACSRSPPSPAMRLCSPSSSQLSPSH